MVKQMKMTDLVDKMEVSISRYINGYYIRNQRTIPVTKENARETYRRWIKKTDKANSHCEKEGSRVRYCVDLLNSETGELIYTYSDFR